MGRDDLRTCTGVSIADPRTRERVDFGQHPDVLVARAAADALTLEVARLRDEVGGKVYRVLDVKLDALRERIEKLNKRGAKLLAKDSALAIAPITLTVSDEHEQVVRTVRNAGIDQEIADIYGAEADLPRGDPRLHLRDRPGRHSHAPRLGVPRHARPRRDQGADEGVGIRRFPVGTGLINQIGEEAAAAVETADLTDYRHAGPDCDHCGLRRKRNQTYVLYEVATGLLRQVGTDCVRDYTGANSPEQVAAWAEYLAALDHDLGYEGMDDGFGGDRRGRRSPRRPRSATTWPMVNAVHARARLDAALDARPTTASPSATPRDRRPRPRDHAPVTASPSRS